MIHSVAPVFFGVQKAMQTRGLELVSEGTYTRNSVAVKTALLRIRKGDPDAIVMVGSCKPVAEFVKLARKLKVEAYMVTISFVGSKALADELGSAGEGVVVTQVVPFYADTSLPLVSDYQKALKALDDAAGTGFVSLEGYLTGRLFAAALDRAGPDLSREQLLSVFQQSVKFDFGGAVLGYGPGDNQGMDKVYLSVLQKDGTFAYVEKLSKTIDTAELP